MSSLCGMFEVLPEDRDEPERLELLDAAIPARFTARLLPFGQGALTAALPRRCLHFTHVPTGFTFAESTGDNFMPRLKQ